MAKYDNAPFAKVNGEAFREMMRREPDRQTFTLTRDQLEAICRDLIEYTDRDADASAWAAQATKNAGENGILRARLETAFAELKACRTTKVEV
jgi:hypothetical protein